MNWKLKEESTTEKKRVYVQEKTGTELSTELIFTDKMGGKWWGFTDLFKIPYIRTAYAKNVADLYATGCTVEDLKTWCRKEKAILKEVKANPAREPEAYEKLYSLILEKEALIDHTVDPLTQHISLATIYVMADDERIDYYDQNEAAKKIQRWKLDPDATVFFLNWLTSNTQNFLNSFNSISRIALNSTKKQEERI